MAAGLPDGEPGNDKAEGARPPALKRQAMLGGTLTQFSHQGVCVCVWRGLPEAEAELWQVDRPGSFSKG